MPSLRRLRGWLLRIVFDRRASAIIGSVLITTFALLRIVAFPWESWLTDGLNLLIGATGVALLVTAIGGRRPDWIEPRDAPSAE